MKEPTQKESLLQNDTIYNDVNKSMLLLLLLLLLKCILVYVGSKGVTRFFKLTHRAAVLFLYQSNLCCWPT
jgi:hypothetical protein